MILELTGAAVVAAALLAGLHLALVRREQWLVACLLLALAYLLVAAPPRSALTPPLEPILRWGLFLATLGTFVRFRFWHRFDGSAESAEAGHRPRQRPQEEQRQDDGL